MAYGCWAEIGRKASDPDLAETEKKVEYQGDNTDRIAVERSFSLSKRCYKMGLVMEYLEILSNASVLGSDDQEILDTSVSFFYLESRFVVSVGRPHAEDT